jgi:hypothetical protein
VHALYKILCLAAKISHKTQRHYKKREKHLRKEEKICIPA